jgi:hypothetical protein
VNPLKSPHEKYIKRAIKTWHEDLLDGREAKTWRESTMQAGKERDEGTWDEWREAERERYWGPREGTEAEEDEQMKDPEGMREDGES